MTSLGGKMDFSLIKIYNNNQTSGDRWVSIARYSHEPIVALLHKQFVGAGKIEFLEADVSPAPAFRS